MADVTIETAASSFSLSGVRSVCITVDSEFFGWEGQNDFDSYSFRRSSVDQYGRPVPGCERLELCGSVISGSPAGKANGWRVAWDDAGKPLLVGIGYATTSLEARLMAFRDLAGKLLARYWGELNV